MAAEDGDMVQDDPKMDGPRTKDPEHVEKECRFPIPHEELTVPWELRMPRLCRTSCS